MDHHHRFSDRDGRVPKQIRACITTTRMGGTCPHDDVKHPTWIRTCVCSFVIAMCVLGAVPTASAAPEATVKGMVGETVELPCDVDVDNCGAVYFITWTKNVSHEWKRLYLYSDDVKKPLQELANPVRAEFITNGPKGHLVIKPLKLEDEGTYKCDVTYVQGKCPSLSFAKLVTIAKPEPPILEEVGKVLRDGETVGPYYEDDTLTLECKSKGGKPAPEVTWWRGKEHISGKVEEEQDSLGRSTVTNTLSLTLTREHIGSKFECRVENEAIKDEPLVSAVELKLLVQPKSMKVKGPSKPVVADDSVTLTCTIDSAVPPAEATWFNRSDPMSVKPEEERTDNDDGTYTTISRLTFNVSRFDHLGTFYCKGTNKVMQAKQKPSMVQSLDLQVLYPPVVVTEPSRGIMVNETNSTEIHCTYTANPSNFTEVFWYKNGVEIVTKDNPKYAVNNPGYPALKIINISRNDHGLYSCSLSNSIGRGNSSNAVDISVHYPPKVRARVAPAVVKEGAESVFLLCNVLEGNPENLRKTRWYKNGELLHEIEDGDIIWNNVSRNMTGNYSCQGENTVGWSEKSNLEELIVNYPPGKTILMLKNAEVVKGESVTIECVAEDMGRPEASSYRWEREGIVLDVHGPNYTTGPVKVSTIGNYSCAAVNSVGIGEKSYMELQASVAPTFVESLPSRHGALWNAHSIIISCRVECEPLCNITWFKDGESIMDSPQYYVKTNTHPREYLNNRFQSVVSTLHWNLTAWPGGTLDRNQDNAYYTCQSSGNSVGPGVNSTTYFMVEYPPENIVVNPTHIDVKEYEVPPSLNCSASSWPPSDYIWKFSDSVIADTPELFLNYSIPRGRAGTYTCIVRNRHGQITAESTVNVMYAPECLILESKNEKEQTIIICETQANPPNVTFTWRRDNESIDMDPVSIGTKSVLTIPDESSAYFGVYQCVASNMVGVSSPCHLEITGEPDEPGWVPVLHDGDIILIAAITAAVVLIFIFIVVIIMLVMRSRRMRNGTKQVLEKRENPDGRVQPTETTPASRVAFQVGHQIGINGSTAQKPGNSVVTFKRSEDFNKRRPPLTDASSPAKPKAGTPVDPLYQNVEKDGTKENGPSEPPETKAMYENMSFHQKPKGPKTPIPAVRTRVCPTPSNPPRLYENIVFPKVDQSEVGDKAPGTAFILPRIQRPASATWVRPKPTPRKTDVTCANGTKGTVLAQTLPRPAKSVFVTQEISDKQETDANKNITSTVVNCTSPCPPTAPSPNAPTNTQVASTKPFRPDISDELLYADLYDDVKMGKIPDPRAKPPLPPKGLGKAPKEPPLPPKTRKKKGSSSGNDLGI